MSFFLHRLWVEPVVHSDTRFELRFRNFQDIFVCHKLYDGTKIWISCVWLALIKGQKISETNYLVLKVCKKQTKFCKGRTRQIFLFVFWRMEGHGNLLLIVLYLCIFLNKSYTGENNLKFVYFGSFCTRNRSSSHQVWRAAVSWQSVWNYGNILSTVFFWRSWIFLRSCLVSYLTFWTS